MIQCKMDELRESIAICVMDGLDHRLEVFRWDGVADFVTGSAQISTSRSESTHVLKDVVMHLLGSAQGEYATDVNVSSQREPVLNPLPDFVDVKNAITRLNGMKELKSHANEIIEQGGIVAISMQPDGNVPRPGGVEIGLNRREPQLPDQFRIEHRTAF